MKLHIFRWAEPDAIEIGDVVLWENDVPVEVESITKTKDGYELSGHNRQKPGTRAIMMRPRGEKLRVLPSAAQTMDLLHEVGVAVSGGWTVEEINDLKPRGKAGSAPTVTTGKADSTTTPADPDVQSTPTAPLAT